MPHRHKVRDIAQQSGLSEATVDRVLHGRPGVRPATVAEVERAVEELDRQATQLRLVGRTFLVDLVMQAPGRFRSAVRTALEAELPMLRPAAVRCRFHEAEHGDPAAAVRTLEKIRRRGSQGVLLKVPDHPDVVEQVAQLTAAGIPVITLVTDLPDSARLAYVGIDNRSAGATAAYLVAQVAVDAGAAVLVTASRTEFRGEEQRMEGFVETLRLLAPDREVVTVVDTDGIDENLLDAVGAVLQSRARSGVSAVYSVGGGNRATLEAFARAGQSARVFVAHDLDEDNAELLRTRRITYVLHHDLRADVRRACRLVMQAHRALPGVPSTVPAPVQVVTPHNQPSGLLPRA